MDKYSPIVGTTQTCCQNGLTTNFVGLGIMGRGILGRPVAEGQGGGTTGGGRTGVCCSIVNITYTNMFYLFFIHPGSPPSMIAYTSCRLWLRLLTVWSPNFDFIMYDCMALILISFLYICIYSYFKFCCFASMCNTSIYVFVKRYTIHGLTDVDP